MLSEGVLHEWRVLGAVCGAGKIRATEDCSNLFTVLSASALHTILRRMLFSPFFLGKLRRREVSGHKGWVVPDVALGSHG